jgi:putative oxidoreductase
MALWQAWANALHQWQWMGMLLARLAVGLLFMLSGAGKLFSPARRQQMRQALIAARIPEPKISAIMVSLVECVFGALLVVGFLTQICCLMLTAVMLGALSTTIVRGIKAQSAANWLGDFLYLPEVLYVVMLVWLFFSGPGLLSLDHLILSSPGQ